MCTRINTHTDMYVFLCTHIAPPSGGGGCGGVFEEKKKQSIVVARLFSYWGGSAVVCPGIGMLVWGARSCTLSLSLSRGCCANLLPGLPRDPRAGSGVKLDLWALRLMRLVPGCPLCATMLPNVARAAVLESLPQPS